MHQFSADIRSGPANLGAMPVRSLMGLVLGNLASSAMDLKRLVDLGQEIDPAPGLCGIQNCPRLGTLEQALREGVDALERTKGSFKSKELGELRRRFEALLEENTPAGQRA
jgi:hypothetical protein